MAPAKITDNAKSVFLKDLEYQFEHPDLLRNSCFVDGEWVKASNGATFKIEDPSDRKTLAEVPDLSKGEISAALDKSSKVFQEFKKVLPVKISKAFVKWAQLLRQHQRDLAALSTLELGKPFKESLGTIDYAADILEWYAGLAERAKQGESIPTSSAAGRTRLISIRQPQGVVVAITPWNSPFSGVLKKVGAAIAAGNTVVLKPAPETPLCAFALAKLFEQSGFLKGVLSVVTCSSGSIASISALLCSHPTVRHISFTGSTAVGKILSTQCGQTLKKTTMELGGNNSFIVFDDANLTEAVDGLIAGKFKSSGQVCICANRVLVQKAIYPQFLERLVARTKETINLGSVWDPKVNFGPLYGIRGLEKVERLVSDAVSKGAEVSLGGEAIAGSLVYKPTVLTKVTPTMDLWHEEIFAPVAALSTFETEDEAISIANDTMGGLAAYVYTENISRTWRLMEALEVGMVGCGTGSISAYEQPFGGIKDSGFGREGSSHALEEYTELKAMTIKV